MCKTPGSIGCAKGQERTAHSEGKKPSSPSSSQLSSHPFMHPSMTHTLVHPSQAFFICWFTLFSAIYWSICAFTATVLPTSHQGASFAPYTLQMCPALYQSHFCHRHKHHDQGSLQMSVFGLMVPEGKEAIIAWKHGSRGQTWQPEQEAKSSHPQPQSIKQNNQAGWM